LKSASKSILKTFTDKKLRGLILCLRMKPTHADAQFLSQCDAFPMGNAGIL
jgi:hypothetical protein